MLSLLAVVGLVGASPVVSSVRNAGSLIPDGIPNYGIAPGQGLLGKELGDVSVVVEVGGASELNEMRLFFDQSFATYDAVRIDAAE